MADKVAGDSARTDTEDIRDNMRDFWADHSPTLDTMMHDTKAQILTDAETQEIMAMLPNLEGKRILELGAGIGRQTGLLAQKAGHVTAVDFTESFIEKNRQDNGHLANADFIHADVMQLEFPANSYDVVFSNWLMMYLSDDELSKLLKHTLVWLTDGGFMFFRETCYHQIDRQHVDLGDDNPTVYRSPTQYNAIIQTARVLPEDNDNFAMGFEIISSKVLQTYVKLRKQQGQLTWLLQKINTQKGSHRGYNTLQSLFDNKQYPRHVILQSEWVYGRGHASAGAIEATKMFVEMLNLKPGQKVLDVGCGIGGASFYMAQSHGAEVLGVDLSGNMIGMAMERAANQNLDLQVQFELSDFTKREFSAESFDVIYSQGSMIYIKNQQPLFVKFLEWMKPGGKLLIVSDFTREPEETRAEDFREYLEERGHTLHTTKHVGNMLSLAGFTKIKVEDRTKEFIGYLDKEKKHLQEDRQDFLKEFSEEDYQFMVNRWDGKVKWSASGDLLWGVAYAEKTN